MQSSYNHHWLAPGSVAVGFSHSPNQPASQSAGPGLAGGEARPLSLVVVLAAVYMSGGRDDVAKELLGLVSGRKRQTGAKSRVSELL